MAKLSSVLFSLFTLFVMGFAYAAQEIPDAPFVAPEPNYIGIILFLVISVFCSVWYIWKAMADGKKDKDPATK